MVIPPCSHLPLPHLLAKANWRSSLQPVYSFTPTTIFLARKSNQEVGGYGFQCCLYLHQPPLHARTSQGVGFYGISKLFPFPPPRYLLYFLFVPDANLCHPMITSPC